MLVFSINASNCLHCKLKYNIPHVSVLNWMLHYRKLSNIVFGCLAVLSKRVRYNTADHLTACWFPVVQVLWLPFEAWYAHLYKIACGRQDTLSRMHVVYYAGKYYHQVVRSNNIVASQPFSNRIDFLDHLRRFYILSDDWVHFVHIHASVPTM